MYINQLSKQQILGPTMSSMASAHSQLDSKLDTRNYSYRIVQEIPRPESAEPESSFRITCYEYISKITEEQRRFGPLRSHETRKLNYYMAFAVMVHQFTKLGVEHTAEDKALESRLRLCSINYAVANLCLVRVERWANVVDRSDPIT